MMLPPLGPKYFDRFLGGKNGSKHIGIELPVKLVLGDDLERLELEDSGIINEHVQ